MCEEDLMACEESQVVFPGGGAPLRYEVCADGLTVADLNTGLLWELKVGESVFSSCNLRNLHWLGSGCTWAQATGAWIDAVNAEGGTGFAGFSDWRVPNVKELQSIVDYGRNHPAINPAFDPACDCSYWSATTVWDGSNTSLAWFLEFRFGQTMYGIKDNGAIRVRAVRTDSCPTP
jgi:hypothetical protein